MKKAQLQKQRSIEQAKRHCYEQAKVQFAHALSASAEAALDVAASRELDERAILGGGRPTEKQTSAAVPDAGHAGVIDVVEWYEGCVASEATLLEAE